MSASLPENTSTRPESAPPQSSAGSEVRSPPPISQMHLPLNPSPLSPHSRRMSAETQPRNAISASLRSVSNQLYTTTSSSSGKGKGKILGIQDKLRKEVDGVVKRRSGGVLARG